MKEEEAIKTRRGVLNDVCVQVQRQGHRLDMQDIIDLIPYRVCLLVSLFSFHIS